jgi:predicted peptidase
MLVSRAFLLASLLACPSIALAQAEVDGFVGRVFRSGTISMPYRLFVPAHVDTTRRYPLIIYLHGSGGAGSDNLRQISGGNEFGTHVWTDPRVQNREPVFVVAPQAAENEQWAGLTDALSPFGAATLSLVDRLQNEFPIDANRIVITGQSRGGFGVWDLAAKATRRFAAAIPLCGAGDPERAAGMRDLPIWAFHGTLDETVPVRGSREMVDALKAAGSRVKYTEYPDLGHAIWQRVYRDSSVVDWALRQRRPAAGSGADRHPSAARISPG